MIYVLMVPALALAAGAAWLATLPGDIRIRRSLVMGAPREALFERIRDFRGWRDWSPWLMHEPDAKLDFSEHPDREGGSYSWDGQLIGAGHIAHTRFEDGRRIEQRLDFVRPFKSTSEVTWELADTDDGKTQVHWTMDGRMPFLLRPLVPLIAAGVEKDYDLGLARLRGLVEPGAPRPEIRFAGPGERAPTTALTVGFSGGMEDMVKAMEDGFPRLATHLQSQGREPPGPPFTAYHRVDPKATRFVCDIAVPVGADLPAPDAAAGMSVKRLPGGRCFTVEVMGSYDFLPLAWYSAMAHLRMKKLKWDRSRPAFETYENDPASVSDTNDLRTRLEIPIR